MNGEDNILSLSNGLQHGEYYLGPVLPMVSPSPIKSLKQYLARNIDTAEFVTMKILNFSTRNGDSAEDNQGKVLLHNEYSVLSILKNTPGIIQHHGLFKEAHRIILVLSCVCKHDYDVENKYQDYVNLQQYVIQKKRLNEREALRLFYLIASTVAYIHEKNIVHRDLKLGNVVLNKRTQQITITNFTLSKHLVRHDDMLTDQRGSLAYVSPDILSGEPYYGKPCDLWSLGILLYTMLYGQFPFYDDNPQDLFKKIKDARFAIPRDIEVSAETTFLLTQLIEPDPQKRLSIVETVESAQSIYSRLSLQLQLEPMQIVPEVDPVNSSDCVVPDNFKSFAATSSSVDLSAPRLCLNPFTDPGESSTNMYLHSSSPIPLHSPSSPASPRIMFFPDYNNSQPPITQPCAANPFISSAHSLPVDTIINPHMSFNSSNSLPIYLVPSSDHSSSPTMTPEFTPPSSSLQMHLHPQQYMSAPPSRQSHRHSFSEGDSSNSSLLTPHAQVRAIHGRRSLGSMLGTRPHQPQRRNSQQHSTSPSYAMYEDLPRVRRRSHEPRDNEREILQGLQAAANRTIRQHQQQHRSST